MMGLLLRIIATALLLTTCGSPSNDVESGASPDCSALVPRDPFSEQSGHSIGFQWGASGKNCGGNSSSFIQGCREYQDQEARYFRCKAQR
jgi:hypothetical protein